MPKLQLHSTSNQLHLTPTPLNFNSTQLHSALTPTPLNSTQLHSTSLNSKSTQPTRLARNPARPLSSQPNPLQPHSNSTHYTPTSIRSPSALSSSPFPCLPCFCPCPACRVVRLRRYALFPRSPGVSGTAAESSFPSWSAGRAAVGLTSLVVSPSAVLPTAHLYFSFAALRELDGRDWLGACCSSFALRPLGGLAHLESHD